jgi:hypothetical protein
MVMMSVDYGNIHLHVLNDAVVVVCQPRASSSSTPSSWCASHARRPHRRLCRGVPATRVVLIDDVVAVCQPRASSSSAMD